MLSDGNGMWCEEDNGIRRRYMSVDICIPKWSPCWLKKPWCIQCDVRSWQGASWCGLLSLPRDVTPLQVGQKVKKEEIIQGKRKGVMQGRLLGNMVFMLHLMVN